MDLIAFSRLSGILLNPFDGADEIDPNHNMIKGRGGAMFKEKLLISSSPQTFIIADPSKMVSKLGSRFPVPVEIFPDALIHADQALRSLSPVDIKLRMAQGKDGPIITENGNLILDVWFNYMVKRKHWKSINSL